MPSIETISLRTNLADYPLTMALKHGRVRSDFVQLDFCGPQNVNAGAKAMLRDGTFDAGEVAISAFLQARCYGKPFVLLPLSISGRFTHHSIAFNGDRGHLDPKDIERKRVGIKSYASTTGLWVRGILQHEYGVNLDNVTWVTTGEAPLSEYRDPPNCERLPKETNLGQMLLDGELAAALLGGKDMPKDPRLRTLIPQPAAAAELWGKRQGILPINHVFAIRGDLARRRPEVVQEIFRMFTASRGLVPEAEAGSLPPIGFDAIRKALQISIDWSLEQKMISRRLEVEELFNGVPLICQ